VTTVDISWDSVLKDGAELSYLIYARKLFRKSRVEHVELSLLLRLGHLMLIETVEGKGFHLPYV
jgi:hypothetical protein